MIRLLILTLALWASACASPPGDTTAATGARDCFHADQIQDWRVLDDNTVQVNASGVRRYALTTMTSVGELRSADNYTITVRSAGTSLVCVGEGPQVDIAASIGGMRTLYPVTRVARLPDPAGS